MFWQCLAPWSAADRRGPRCLPAHLGQRGRRITRSEQIDDRRSICFTMPWRNGSFPARIGAATWGCQAKRKTSSAPRPPLPHAPRPHVRGLRPFVVVVPALVPYLAGQGPRARCELPVHGWAASADGTGVAVSHRLELSHCRPGLWVPGALIGQGLYMP